MRPKHLQATGDRETSVKIMRPKHPQGDKRGDKCKNHAAKAPTGDWRQWGTSGRQMGDKCKIMRPKRPQASRDGGRQVGDKCKITRPRQPQTVRQERQPGAGDTCKIKRPVMHSFQRSRSPSQVNLFGE